MSTRGIVKKDPADFTPTLGNYTDLQPFRFWCQKVLPLVYDDSLSYYELLCKVVDYLNKTMEDVGVLEGDVTGLHEAYKKLQGYVNDYFSTLDVQEEINNKLDEMASNGTLGEILKSVITVNQPVLVNNKEDMVNTSYLYILASDGYVYYYDGTKFVPSTLKYNAPVNAYTAGSFTTPIKINDIKSIGTYTVDSESLTGLVSENVDDYYWTCCCVAPIVKNNVDVLQYLIGIPMLSSNAAVFYYRYSLTGSFKAFTRTTGSTPNIRDYYTSHNFTASVDINTIKSIGTYTVNSESLTGLVSENVDDYYWTCCCVTPIVKNNVDVLQYLIGIPMASANAAVFYYRYSLTGSFKAFTKIYNNTVNNIKKVCFCGDSFTAVTSVKSYVDFLNECGHCDGTNLGISGSYPSSWLQVHEKDITSEYDIYFIAFGLNALDTPDGTYNDNTDSTFCGQMNILIDKIYNVCPNARIIVWCMDGWFTEARSNALKELSSYKGCEFYSMKSDEKIPVRLNGKFDGVLPNLSNDVVTLKNNALKLVDNHPNEKAQKLLATYLTHII
jgi:hypothetical protein|nr:MAG TPA: SGNH-hydrolase family esterase [Caudoviricetes sp.]